MSLIALTTIIYGPLYEKQKIQLLMERVEALEQYEKKEMTGLQAHLHILLHSELGHYFKLADSAINLSRIIEQNAVIYFALPALKFPSFSKVLGKLVANDLKAVIGHSVHKIKKYLPFLMNTPSLPASKV